MTTLELLTKCSLEKVPAHCGDLYSRVIIWVWISWAQQASARHTISSNELPQSGTLGGKTEYQDSQLNIHVFREMSLQHSDLMFLHSFRKFLSGTVYSSLTWCYLVDWFYVGSKGPGIFCLQELVFRRFVAKLFENRTAHSVYAIENLLKVKEPAASI